MLGDILCNQLLVSHLVATFSAGDHHDSHGRYAVRASGSKHQNEYVFLLCLTWRIIKPDGASKHAHFVAWDTMTSIFQECCDYHRQKMSWRSEWSRVGCYLKCNQRCDLSINCLSIVTDPSAVYVICFELPFSHECWWLKQWHLIALFTARKKNHDYACVGIKLSLSVRVSGLT